MYNVKNKKSDIFPNFSTRISRKSDKIREMRTFSIIDTEKHARTLAEARTSQGSFGYIRMPLTSIDFSDCVVDMLHLFLRITDQLEKLLLDDIKKYGIVLIGNSENIEFFFLTT